MKTIEIQLFKFDELSDEAKQTAINNYRESYYEDDFWQGERLESFRAAEDLTSYCDLSGCNCNNKYMVAYTTNWDPAGNHKISEYAVFIDAEDNLKAAQDFYQSLLQREDLYSASITQIIKSTDY